MHHVGHAKQRRETFRMVTVWAWNQSWEHLTTHTQLTRFSHNPHRDNHVWDFFTCTKAGGAQEAKIFNPWATGQRWDFLSLISVDPLSNPRAKIKNTRQIDSSKQSRAVISSVETDWNLLSESDWQEGAEEGKQVKRRKGWWKTLQQGANVQHTDTCKEQGDDAEDGKRSSQT